MAKPKEPSLEEYFGNIVDAAVRWVNDPRIERWHVSSDTTHYAVNVVFTAIVSPSKLDRLLFQGLKKKAITDPVYYQGGHSFGYEIIRACNQEQLIEQVVTVLEHFLLQLNTAMEKYAQEELRQHTRSQGAGTFGTFV